MAHLFTKRHYDKNMKPKDHEHYHGDRCEAFYLEGIGLSAKVKALRMLIGLKRASIETIRKSNRYGFTSAEMMWIEVETARQDPRTIPELQLELRKVEFNLSYARLRYQIEFMGTRNFDPEFIRRTYQYGSDRIRQRFYGRGKPAIETLMEMRQRCPESFGTMPEVWQSASILPMTTWQPASLKQTVGRANRDNPEKELGRNITITEIELHMEGKKPNE